MGTEDGGADAAPEETIGGRVLSTIQSTWEVWENFKAWTRNYTPYFVRFIEIILTIIFVVGFSYWLYLYFVVGV